MDEIREGYIIDYISGLQVKETPEEVEAIQPFSKILVDDYGYPKSHVHTRPQYRVKVRSSKGKTFGYQKGISGRYCCFLKRNT